MDSYKIKTLEVAGGIYENVEVPNRQTLVNAIEQSKVIAIKNGKKKIYINGSYVVSFEGVDY